MIWVRAGRNPPSVLSRIPLSSLPGFRAALINPVWPCSPRVNRFTLKLGTSESPPSPCPSTDLVSVLLPSVSRCASRHRGAAGREEFPQGLPAPAHQLAPNLLMLSLLLKPFLLWLRGLLRWLRYSSTVGSRMSSRFC